MTKWMRRDEYSLALNHARKARRRGDLAAAERWLKQAERHMSLFERNERLNALPPAEPEPTPTRTGPVMLDPRGFSPGGTPNWVLNQQRMERAGFKQYR